MGRRDEGMSWKARKRALDKLWALYGKGAYRAPFPIGNETRPGLTPCSDKITETSRWERNHFTDAFIQYLIASSQRLKKGLKDD
jgi:hypothetical protein